MLFQALPGFPFDPIQQEFFAQSFDSQASRQLDFSTAGRPWPF
jgi:hypothetical protein